MVVDLFLVYQFIRRLATPFEKWPAYETGVIDGDGNILIKKKDRLLVSQRKSFGIFDLMILKLKKLLGKIPGGKSRLASYAAALWLIKEWKHFSEDSLLNESVTEEQIDESLELFLNRYDYYNTLSEDVNGKIHPAVIKAYKNSRNAEHRDGEYGTTATKRAVTRTANTLSKKINQHHPDLDMQGKIKIRTQLQNMKEDGPCWSTHKQVGMKKKGNKIVPNCVPKEELEEKLKATDDMGKWIDDFQKSDAPQFKGKSKEKRRQMAIAAKYGAEREAGMRENSLLRMKLVNKIKNSGVVKSGSMAKDKNIETKPKLKEDDIDELSMSLKDLTKTGLNKKAFGNKDKLKKDLEKLKKGLKEWVCGQCNCEPCTCEGDEYKIQEAAAPRWKRAGPNGEIQATIGGKKYQIEKALDNNERHKGEWKVMVWDKRRNSWEWETTEYGKANAKAWIMNRMNEEPTNTVGGGAIAGMDAGHMSKAAQRKWVQSNKRKRKTLRDIMKGGLV